MQIWRHDPLLHRSWLFDARIHHGLLGLSLFAAGLSAPLLLSRRITRLALIGIGIALMWDDRTDLPVWFDLYERRTLLGSPVKGDD